MNLLNIAVDFTAQIQSKRFNYNCENNQKKVDQIQYKRSIKYQKSTNMHGSQKVYRCKICHYKSNRQYNVLRHEKRIHSQKLKRSCCGKIFCTKGEWYFHCENCHPNLRASSFISKKKYKIIKNTNKSLISSTVNEENSAIRRSARIQESFEKQQLITLEKFDQMQMEDVPLIYFIKNKKLRDEFIKKSNKTYEKTNSAMTLSENSLEIHSDDNINNLSLMATPENKNHTNSKVFCESEIVKIKAFKLINSEDGNEINFDNVENNLSNNQSRTNLKFTYTEKSTRTYQTVNTPIYLPLKKRILQELQNGPIDKNRQRRLKEKSTNENHIFKYNDKENINPILKSHYDTDNLSKKVTVIRAEESITWNEITQHHRAYLSSIDFERFKLF